MEETKKISAAVTADKQVPRAAHVQREFLAGVVALYGKKQLMIESIRREELLEPTG